MGRNDHMDVPDQIVRIESPGMLRRGLGLDIAEVREHEGNDGPAISGYAAVFYDGTPDTEFEMFPGFVERIMPGAFDEAIKQDVRGLFNHDPSMILGRTGAGTMELRTDKKGLFYSIDVGGTAVASDVLEHIRRKDVTGSSFSFLITDQTFKTEDKIDIREVEGVDLFDVGPVTFPAYEATTTDARDNIGFKKSDGVFGYYKNAGAFSAEVREIRQQIAGNRVSIPDVTARGRQHRITQRTAELLAGKKF